MITRKTFTLIFILLLCVMLLISFIIGCNSQTQKGLKIYIDSDLEGVSGVVSFERHTYSSALNPEQSKILLTKEINAAVEGLLEEGVSEIVLWDDHGSGGVNIDYLHPAVDVIMGEGDSFTDTIDDSFDAIVFIGKHAMSNAPKGNLAHSFSSRSIENIWLNGKLVGEIAWTVLQAGHYQVPSIFLSGDDAACEEIRDLIPNIETTAVKKGITLNSALCLSPENARKEIKAGVKKAIRRIDEFQLYSVAPPYEIVVEYKTPEIAENKAKREGWERISDTKCTFQTDDILSIEY
ncbi:M55 family metallopeptidase [Candidatus Latescibacterota bacterium]